MIDIYEVVKKLVGDIEPVGASHIDKYNFENLKVMIGLIDKLYIDINNIIYQNEDAQEESIKQSVDFVNKFLDRLGIVE